MTWGHRPFSVPPSLPWLQKGEIAVQRTGSFCASLAAGSHAELPLRFLKSWFGSSSFLSVLSR